MECAPTDTPERVLGVVPSYWLSRYIWAPGGELENWMVPFPEDCDDVHPVIRTQVIKAKMIRSRFIPFPFYWRGYHDYKLNTCAIISGLNNRNLQNQY
jgi:hypothetical protein